MPAGNHQLLAVACLLEAQELIPNALILFMFGFGVCLVAAMAYQLMFDPNAVDVASRLEALSIDPDKWIRRS